MLFPTTLVGSYPQPEWLIDRQKLAGRFPPRTRAKELWRVAADHLEEAQNDATLMAIRAQEEAGLDIITDGEIRRESYSNRFATALSGIDIDNPGTALDRSGHPNPVPRVVGPIKRLRPVEVDDLKFLKAHTDRKVKITVPGPFTMSEQAQTDFTPPAKKPPWRMRWRCGKKLPTCLLLAPTWCRSTSPICRRVRKKPGSSA